MAAENWITIGGFIATTASAIAAFFAVKQTMLQRIVLTKPQIIMSNQEVNLLHCSDSTFSLAFEDLKLYHDIPIFIKNVGLGTALNIKYSYSFYYKKTIKLCNFIEIDEDQMISIIKKKHDTRDKLFHITNEKDSKYNYFKFIKNGKFQIYGIKKEHNELEYVMPIAQEKVAASIEFPSLILLLLAESAYSETVSDGAMFDAMSAGQLSIFYEDISGNKISIKFDCNIRWIKFQSNTENGPCSTYRIEFQRVHPETMPRLKRLRKSYAKFISNHYIN